MRKHFSTILRQSMKEDDKIYLIAADLGFGLFESIQKDFPGRYINPGAAEQLAMGIATGLALEGKKPFLYSITPFAILRPFELIRTYIKHENIPVQIVGAGIDKDYLHDGISHWATDIPKILKAIEIPCFSPTDLKELEQNFERIIRFKTPSVLLLRR